MAIHKTPAIVIGRRELGESDRLVDFYTLEFGKLRAWPRQPVGCASIRSALELFTLGELVFFDTGRSELVRVDHFDIVTPFVGLREHLERLGQGRGPSSVWPGCRPIAILTRRCSGSSFATFGRSKAPGGRLDFRVLRGSGRRPSRPPPTHRSMPRLWPSLPVRGGRPRYCVGWARLRALRSGCGRPACLGCGRGCPHQAERSAVGRRASADARPVPRPRDGGARRRIDRAARGTAPKSVAVSRTSPPVPFACRRAFGAPRPALMRNRSGSPELLPGHRVTL
mgnify:CR=1 FL=1